MNQEDVYQQLAERIFMGNSAIIPELWRMIADEEEARILLATPATAGELADKFGCAAEDMEEKLGALFRKGVLFKAAKPGGTVYRACRDLVQFHDASILWPEAPRAYHDLWKRFMAEEWPDFARMVSQVLPKPFSRIVPVEQPVEARSRILAYEDVEKMIRDSGRVAVANCTCRLIEGNCDKPLEVCLQVGKAADYTVERGSGREVSMEEAIEIVRAAEEAGLVHVTMNRAEDSHFICNCCDDCCMSFTLIVQGINLCDPSRFRAVVDEDKCTGCGTCQDRCFFGAVELVARDGAEVNTVDPEKCMGCGLCMVTCPGEAITLVAVRDEDFIPS
jgi:Fe-S-cluster-containing hydrogenase component 2